MTSTTRRRADAQRNIAAILDAGLACLARGSEVNMAEIARSAGVGRVTLYGHFPSKETLVDALVEHAVGRADEALAEVDLDADPAPAALSRLIASSWRILDQHRRLMVAGFHHLGPARMRIHHDAVLGRVERLIARGQRDGDFRADLAPGWLVTTFYTVLHAAAEEVDAGRLDSADAARVVSATLLAAFSPPS